MNHLILRAVLLIDGLLGGMFLCSAMIEHAMAALGAAEWLAYTQAKERLFGPVMPVFFGVGLLLTILAAIVLAPHLPLTVAAVLLLGAGVVTRTINLPLNARFRCWTATAVPPDWVSHRARWRQWNDVRVACAILAFAALLCV